MMRVFGSLLVLLSALGLGLRQAGKLKARADALLDLRKTIQTFQIGISFEALPLEELVRLGRDSRFCVLAAGSEHYPGNARRALELAGETLLKDPDDRELYQSFIRDLGASGVGEQLEHLALYARLTEQNLAAARDAQEKKSRLCVCTGLFFGVLLCLILL